MRIFTLIFAFFLAFGNVDAKEDFYELQAKDIDGNMIEFSQFEGKKLMIVNTASKCYYTPQYEDLQELYKEYGGENFEIIGFPANNFANQEPGSNEDIKEFCKENYGVTFTMMSKISVKGEDMHPVYQWLTQKSKNGAKDSEVNWNFQKYLVTDDGELYAMASTKTSPKHKLIIEWLESGTSVNDGEISRSSHIYPNPANETLRIECEMITSADIDIINTSGDIVARDIRLVGGIATINTAGLPSGSYFLRIHSESGVIVKPFAIAR
jgi:glutathione peroxidase